MIKNLSELKKLINEIEETNPEKMELPLFVYCDGTHYIDSIDSIDLNMDDRIYINTHY